MKSFWYLQKHDYLHCILENNLTEFTYQDIFDCLYWSRYISINLEKLLNDGVLTVTYHSEKRRKGSVTVPLYRNNYVNYKREKVLNKILK